MKKNNFCELKSILSRRILSNHNSNHHHIIFTEIIEKKNINVFSRIYPSTAGLGLRRVFVSLTVLLFTMVKNKVSFFAISNCVLQGEMLSPEFSLIYMGETWLLKVELVVILTIYVLCFTFVQVTYA